MEYHGMLFNIMEHHGIHWSTMEQMQYNGTTWNASPFIYIYIYNIIYLVTIMEYHAT